VYERRAEAETSVMAKNGAPLSSARALMARIESLIVSYGRFMPTTRLAARILFATIFVLAAPRHFTAEAISHAADLGVPWPRSRYRSPA
jgi:hypothetical protein